MKSHVCNRVPDAALAGTAATAMAGPALAQVANEAGASSAEIIVTAREPRTYGATFGVKF